MSGYSYKNSSPTVCYAQGRECKTINLFKVIKLRRDPSQQSVARDVMPPARTATIYVVQADDPQTTYRKAPDILA